MMSLHLPLVDIFWYSSVLLMLDIEEEIHTTEQYLFFQDVHSTWIRLKTFQFSLDISENAKSSEQDKIIEGIVR